MKKIKFIFSIMLMCLVGCNQKQNFEDASIGVAIEIINDGNLSLNECSTITSIWSEVIHRRYNYYYINSFTGEFDMGIHIESKKDWVYCYSFETAIQSYISSKAISQLFEEIKQNLDSCNCVIYNYSSVKGEDAKVYDQLLVVSSSAEAILRYAKEPQGSLLLYSQRVLQLKDEYEKEVRKLEQIINSVYGKDINSFNGLVKPSVNKDVIISQIVSENEKQKQEEFLNWGQENISFLEQNKLKDGVTTTASGLQYKVIKAGKGSIPTANNYVKVHYEGKLINGTVFDSSYQRGEPVSYRPTDLIKGWTEALLMMPVGSKWELYIPAELAYGEDGSGERIPAYSTLIFTVELLGKN